MGTRVQQGGKRREAAQAVSPETILAQAARRTAERERFGSQRDQRYRDEERYIPEDTSLGRVVLALHSTFDPEAQFARLLAEIPALAGLDGCWVGLLDSENETFIFRTTDGPPTLLHARLPQAGHTIPAPTALYEALLFEGQPILTDDYRAECRRRNLQPRGPEPERPGRGWIGLPLCVGEQVIGAFAGWRLDRAIDAEAIERLQSLAAQCASALANAMHHRSVERRQREEAAFSAIAQDLAASIDSGTILEQIARHARNLLAGDIGHLTLYDAVIDRLCVRGFSADTFGPVVTEMRPSEGLAGYIWRTGASVIASDYPHDPRFSMPIHVRTDATIRSWQSAIGVPIALDDERLGVLQVGSQERRHFTARDQAILTRLTTLAALAVRSARLFAAEQARATRAEALREIGRDLSANLALDRLLDSLRRHLTELTGLDSYWVGLCNEPYGAQLSLWVEEGERRPEAEGPLPLPLPPSMFRAVMDEGRSIRTDDYVAECQRRGLPTAGFRADRASRAWLGIPLQAGGRAVGALAVWNWGKPISAEVTATLETLAGQIATALENARLYETAERQRREEAAFSAITQDLAASLDGDEVLDRIVSHACTLLDGDTGHINLYDAEHDRLILRAFYDERDENVPVFHPGEGLAGYVWATGQPTISADYFDDPRFLPSKRLSRSEHPEGFAAGAVPITLGDERLGVLTVGKRARHEFTSHDATILARLATHAALAVHNARLFAAAQERAARLEVLNDIARELSTEIDFDRFLGSIWGHVRRITPVDGCWVSLWDAANDELQYCLYIDRGERLREAETPQKRGTSMGLAWAVLDEARPIRVADYTTECQRRNLIPSGPNPDLDHTPWLGLPLQINGHLVGAMAVWRREHFADEETATLATLANQIAATLENARLYREARTLAVTDALTGLLNHRHMQERFDQELARAARHGQSLAVVMLDLDNFKLFNDTYGHPAGDQILRATAAILRAATRTTDIIARYGGDEFCLILPQTDQAGALELVERVQEHCRNLRLQGESRAGLPAPRRDEIPLRVSAGIAVYPQDAKDRHELVTRADVALYANKRGGRPHVGTGPLTSEGVDLSLVTSASFGVIEGLVLAVDAKDQYTVAHSQLVADTAVLLAKALCLPEASIATLQAAGMLHDVGKISIPDRILRKPGPLNNEEWQVMRQHVEFSELIIRGAPGLQDILEPVMHHHERWDGQGYPRGLAGEAVPLLGRIMIVADAYSAMVLDRPYRRGLSVAQAVEQLQAGAGSQFDPGLIAILCDTISRAALQEIVNLIIET